MKIFIDSRRLQGYYAALINLIVALIKANFSHGMTDEYVLENVTKHIQQASSKRKVVNVKSIIGEYFVHDLSFYENAKESLTKWLNNWLEVYHYPNLLGQKTKIGITVREEENKEDITITLQNEPRKVIKGVKVHIDRQSIEETKNDYDLIVASFLISKCENALQRHIPFDLSFKKLKQVMKGTRCQITGEKLTEEKGLPNSKSLDRIDNSVGYIDSNICLTSERFNKLKGSMTPEEIKALYTFIKRRGLI